jgi:hypothetical protein
MKTLHLPMRFHRRDHSHTFEHLKDFAHDYRAQSILSRWFLLAMFLIMLFMALQAD